MARYPKLLLAWIYLLEDNVPAQIRSEEEVRFDNMLLNLIATAKEVSDHELRTTERALEMISDREIYDLCCGEEEDQEKVIVVLEDYGFSGNMIHSVLDEMWNRLDFGVRMPSK